jgi:25S rRNA (uracil2634-N3)-methyltransferase
LERSIKHYSNVHQILLVGEGDFSFSSALANAFGSAENMVATSLDSREKLLQFYKSAHETLSNLERLGALILHGVDVTTMEEHHIIRKMRFHRIIYNFPHAGFCGQEYDLTVIKKHRHLLKMFFKNARTMVSEIGEIHVTHKEKDPYNKWELVKQAEECGLLLKESVHFTKEDYPGYINRRGAPPKAGGTFVLGECRTYKFVLCPDFLYKHEIMAIQVVLPNISSEASAENFKMAILEPEPQRQLRMEGKMAKADAENSFNYLKMLADKEFARQNIDTLHQIAQAWRVKAMIAEQLDEALDLKEDAIKRKETILKEAILELQSERQARKDAETENAHLEACLNHLKVVLIKELNENDELKRQRETALLKEDAILRKEVRLKEVILELESERRAREDAETEKADLEASLNYLKTILIKELDKNDNLTKQRDEALRPSEEAGREKINTDIPLVPSLVSSSLAFALFLFHKCKTKIKGASKNEQGCNNDDCTV